jgi:N-glycosylase/DNA lyase
VDYGPVVFPSHIGKVFQVKIVCLVLVVFEYIFSAYILLYFIVSYRFTQRGSFVYCCFSQQNPDQEVRSAFKQLIEVIGLCST